MLLPTLTNVGLPDKTMITINQGDNNSVVGVTSVSSNSTSSSSSSSSATSSSTTSTNSIQTVKSQSIRIDVDSLSSVTREIEDRYLFDTEQAKIREYEMYRRIERSRRRGHRRKHQLRNTSTVVTLASTTCTNNPAVAAVVNQSFAPNAMVAQNLGCNIQTQQQQQQQCFQPPPNPGLNYVNHMFPPILDTRFVVPVPMTGLMHMPVHTMLNGCQLQHIPYPQPLYVPNPSLQPWMVVNNNSIGTFGNQNLFHQQLERPYFNTCSMNRESSLSPASIQKFNSIEGVFQLDM